MPEPWSLPDQLTWKLGCVAAGSGAIRLVGSVASTVLVVVGVTIGALRSKTMLAVFRICAPVASPGLERTV